MFENIELSKKDKRQISNFVSQELIYDYLSNHLDEERSALLKEKIDNNPEILSEKNKLESAIQYCHVLGKTSLSTELKEHIEISDNYIEHLVKRTKFQKWPEGLRLGLETLFIISLVVLVLNFTPWEKLVKAKFNFQKDYILAEVTKEQREGTIAKLHEIEKNEAPQFKDEEKQENEGTVKATSSVNTSQVSDLSSSVTSKPDISVTDVENKFQQQAAAQSSKRSVVNSAESTTQKAINESIKKEIPDSPKSSVGFLYRGQIKVSNLGPTSFKITQKISELGGRKAGEVDLGWMKTNKQSYYHFTLPEAKYKELTTFLSGFGKSQLVKERHPKVMPDGIIRLILVVDERN